MVKTFKEYELAVNNSGERAEIEMFRLLTGRGRNPERDARIYERYLREKIAKLRGSIDYLGEKACKDVKSRLEILERIERANS